MEKVIYQILKNYREIVYLMDKLNDFDLKSYLKKKGVYGPDDMDNSIVDKIKEATEELKNYPTSRALDMSTIIEENYLSSENKKLEDVASELGLTSANAYRLRRKAIHYIAVLISETKEEAVL